MHTFVDAGTNPRIYIYIYIGALPPEPGCASGAAASATRADLQRDNARRYAATDAQARWAADRGYTVRKHACFGERSLILKRSFNLPRQARDKQRGRVGGKEAFSSAGSTPRFEAAWS